MKPRTIESQATALRVVPKAEAPQGQLVQLVAKGLGLREEVEQDDGLLANALGAAESELRLLSELTFNRDSHVSAALGRLAERIAAVLELNALAANNGEATR